MKETLSWKLSGTTTNSMEKLVECSGGGGGGGVEETMGGGRGAVALSEVYLASHEAQYVSDKKILQLLCLLVLPVL